MIVIKNYKRKTYRKYSTNQLWWNIPAAVEKYKAVRSITTGRLSLRSMFKVATSE